MKGSNPKIAKKLASLSALGAGALVLSAPDQAEAAAITYVTVNKTLSSLNGPASVNIPLSGLSSRHLLFSVYATGSAVKAIALGTSNLWFSTRGSNVLKLFNPGDPVLLTGGTCCLQHSNNGSLSIAKFFTDSGNFTPVASGNGQFQHKFAVFSVWDSFRSHYDFGWVQLSLSAPAGSNNLTLTIQDYAYDSNGTTSAQGLPPGTTGAVPEPATLGLAAMALGAVGLRRWRAARKAA